MKVFTLLIVLAISIISLQVVETNGLSNSNLSTTYEGCKDEIPSTCSFPSHLNDCSKLHDHCESPWYASGFCGNTQGLVKNSCRKTCWNCGGQASVQYHPNSCPVQNWTPNKAYAFEYHGRLLTGLPSLSSQYSGVGIQATVKVFAKTGDILVLKVQDPKYVDVNNVLHPRENGADNSYKNDGWNWRLLDLPPLKQVPAEYAHILARPVEFVLACDGEVREVIVSKDEPEWSINFKKALIVQFQTKVDSYSVELQQNKIELPSDGRRTTWRVKEDSLQGTCENTYGISELPEYVIKENPELIPLPSRCPTDPATRIYFEITRTRNLHSCKRRARSNFFKPGRVNPLINEESNGGAMNSHMSVTRSFGCASVPFLSSKNSRAVGITKALRASNIVIQRIINENEQNENMMGFNTEKFVTGTKQVLTLRGVEDIETIPVVSHPMKLFDLMYEYDTTMTPLQGISNVYGNNRGADLDKGRLSKGANGVNESILAKVNPKASLSVLSGSQSSVISTPQINSQIMKLLKEVTETIIESERAGDTEDANVSNINLKLLGVSRGFAMFENSQPIKNVWEQVDSSCPSENYRQIVRNYFVDTLAMAGTPASVEFIVDMIEQDELSQYQIVNYLLWLPHYILYPTIPTLENLHRIIRSEKVQSHPTRRNIAITSFSQLLQQSCMSGDRKSSYPTFVVGEFCDANSRILKTKWIPYLLGELASSQDSNDRNIYLMALAVLQHEDTITELIPYVSGALTQQVGDKVSELNRIMAISSLATFGNTQANVVIPVLITVLSNPAETSEMRISAFNCLLRMNPSSSVFQRIAAITHQEPSMDSEILKTINIALYSLGNAIPTGSLEPHNVDLVNKARATFHLIKRVNGILPSSGTIYSADFLKRLGVGYEAFVAYVASEASFFPKGIHTEIRYLLDLYSVSGIRTGFRVSGAENLYETLGESLMKRLTGVSAPYDRSSQGTEWVKIKQIFGNINGQLKDSKMDAAFLFQLFENAPLFLTKENFSSDSLAKNIVPYLKNPELLKQKLGSEVNVNAQRTFDLAQRLTLIPTDMGFPINVEYHTPISFSVIGKMTPTLQAATPKLEISGKIVFAGQYIGTVGTVVPFCQDLLLTGVNQHTVINIPGMVQLEMNIPSQKVSVMIKPHPRVTTPLDIMHFHRYPFTASQKISDLTPICEQPQMKPIRSPAQLKTAEEEFGEYFGLKMTAKIETESQYADVASIFDILKMYKNNPINLVVFPWTVPSLSESLNPSARNTRFSVIYYPSQSSTKEIGFEFRVGYALKKIGEASGKYQILKVKNTLNPFMARSGANFSMGSEWSELAQNLSPYVVVEKTIGISTVHPRREQKLKEMFDAAELTSGATGISVHFTAVIKGNRPRTWSSALSMLIGRNSEVYGSMKQMWDIRLERPLGSPNAPNHICVKGTLKLPILHIWSIEEFRLKPIDFIFENKISMGTSSCNEATITTSGNARVSEQQKEFSQKSLQSLKCQEMVQRGSLAATSSRACLTSYLQARTLDTIELTNQFIRVPEVVKTWEQRLVTITKAYMWPYTSSIQSYNHRISGNTFTTNMNIQFQKWARAFDLIIKRPTEELAFTNVRIPYPLTLFVPLKAGLNNLNLATQKITSFCYMAKDTIRTFSGNVFSINPEIEGCYNILTGDSERHTFAIEYKKGPESQSYAIKVIIGDNVINLRWEMGRPMAALQYANGTTQAIPLPESHDGTIYIVRPIEDVMMEYMTFGIFHVVNVQVKDTMAMSSDGKSIFLQINPSFKNTLDGLCGTPNTNIRSAKRSGLQSCKYTTTILEVASNRIQTASCPQLRQTIKEELEKEKAKCISSQTSFIRV